MASADQLRVILGATASGKTALALEIAARAGAEIVSLDSMLVYRGMDIGTAKPSAAERARVRHHALDLVAPHEEFTVQQYLAAAESALADAAARGARALFVGGTAFYYKTLVHGLFRGPDVDRELRARLELRFDREGAAALHAELARVDPRAAARIHCNDRKRVVRALEVFEQTGAPLSDLQREWGWDDGASGAPAGRARRVIELVVPVDELDRRIAERTRAMLDAGWVEEALRIRAEGGFSATSRQALGYAEVLRLADGELGRADAVAEIALRTRQFARRQRTWLRKFEEARRVASPENEQDLAQRVDEVLEWFDWR
ncbi:MAG: tRNA (adenosine(37)-N6)-dimethylallyltransferase MiaA [Planctomycetes bacterium]|nr:tRNA (adenosine(37)-N6)-dimethylallyltransferase MiaA [Planctomycetota bacterium]